MLELCSFEMGKTGIQTDRSGMTFESPTGTVSTSPLRLLPAFVVYRDAGLRTKNPRPPTLSDSDTAQSRAKQQCPLPYFKPGLWS